tara:strand:+ start:2492 stop:3463 length:972 start_codon:yes stop_codon:yes gene_type:complete
MIDCLYINKLKFEKSNLLLLKKNFKLTEAGNIDRCPKNKINNIKILILPMDKFYGEKLLEKFNSLKIIASPTTGDIHIDKKYLKRKKIKFLNLKKNSPLMRNITATSDLVFAFIFELTRKVLNSSFNFHYKKLNFEKKFIAKNSLKDLSVGIIGLGRIGNHVAERSKALGMKVFYYDPEVINKKYTKVSNLIRLFKESNIITLHLHYEEYLKNIINLKLFKIQKKPSFFINTSRGEFVNEESLIYSVKKNILCGFALDVIKGSFMFNNKQKKNKLLNFYGKNFSKNIIITPKVAGSTSEAREMTENYLINNIIKNKKDLRREL